MRGSLKVNHNHALQIYNFILYKMTREKSLAIVSPQLRGLVSAVISLRIANIVIFSESVPALTFSALS